MRSIKKDHLTIAVRVVSICVVAWTLLCRAPAQQRNFDLVKLSDDAYAAIALPGGDAAANAGFVITDSWVCVFDSHLTPDAAKELIAEIRKLTKLPIRYLINSHYHADHSHGNQAFAQDVELISSHATWQAQLNKDLPQLQRYQQLLPEQIARLKKELNSSISAMRAEEIRQELQQREQFLNRISGLEVVLAGTTFDHTLSLRTLDRELQLIFLGRGHTDGDIVLWLPEERILFAGDLVSLGALPNLMDGYSKEWIDTLAAILKMKPEVIVPGHGLAGDDSMVSALRDFLQDLRKAVKSGMDKGLTLEELLKSIQAPARFRDYRGQEFLPGAIERVYRELREEALAEKAEKKATP
jgi:glyoxylase-like metal-dependent hydrolase (beta-lactamase superfamily II)